jgi:hypothetical protein
MIFSLYEIDGSIEIDNYKSNLSVFTTPWSIAHFVSGYMTSTFGINYFLGLIIHTIYELFCYFNRTIKKQWSESWKGFRTDSISNGIGDTLVFMLGMLLSKKYNNIYLFIFIFLVGFIFFSKNFQDFLVNHRLQYLKSKDNTLNIDNRKFYTYSYYLDYIWIIVSLITFIKLYIIHKKNKIN